MPSCGSSVTDRLLVVVSGGPQTSAGWLGFNSSILSNSERMLDAWVSRLLGDARHVRCTVERLDDLTGAVTETSAFLLSELPLTPLDFVYGVEATGSASQPSPSLSYIEQLVLYQARRRPGGFGAQANLRLQHTRPTNLAVCATTPFDLLEQRPALPRLL